MLIRKAKEEDAPLVAWTVLTALDMEEKDMAKFVDCCSRPDSMYSWTNALIAEVDGKAVGCLIAYDGARYGQLRANTWPTLWDNIDPETLANTAAETQGGEYYLDSMAILPQYRGAGIGAQLMKAAIEEARASGIDKCALLVDVNKSGLRRYYEGMGFGDAEVMTFLGHQFYKLSLML